jgi:hypothetical protein
MTFRRVLGFLMLLIGILLILASRYIKNQVEQGQQQINSAQSKVNQADSLFSLNPTSKQVGQVVTGSAQNKINEGKQQVVEYTTLAERLNISGIVVVVLGIGYLILFGIKKKRGS